ncbi:hypothetical protein HSIEG1_3601 [Enterococcus sp. HSIEG1]|nr:hypothetical protein HSIEG1_3601 [Enterococcus sp. HSIEG1]
MAGRSQTGLVVCTSIEDYVAGKIKKHEFTRPEKEVDRINHIQACDANTSPIFLSYRQPESLKKRSRIGRVTINRSMISRVTMRSIIGFG